NGKSTAGHQRYLCSQGSDAQWNENSR
ncbi:TPA: IS1 family transposase, partial [Escherichia coli]|nr:hypothetical protein [Escherichia coli]